LKYDKGQGVVQNYAEAAKWYHRAADQGSSVAQFNLGLMYDSGKGMVKDYVQAHMWISLARAHTNVDGETKYAAMRDRVAAKMTPAQVAEAQRRAARWYLKSAEQGKSWDQFNLGVMYDNGQGIERDHVEAAKWYRKAADQGFEEAQFHLGLKYESGQGVEKDYVQAHMWLTLATSIKYSGKDKKYAAMRDRVAAKMTPAQVAEAQRRVREWKRRDARIALFTW
jgi:uncharacterized protein